MLSLLLISSCSSDIDEKIKNHLTGELRVNKVSFVGTLIDIQSYEGCADKIYTLRVQSVISGDIKTLQNIRLVSLQIQGEPKVGSDNLVFAQSYNTNPDWPLSCSRNTEVPKFRVSSFCCQISDFEGEKFIRYPKMKNSEELEEVLNIPLSSVTKLLSESRHK